MSNLEVGRFVLRAGDNALAHTSDTLQNMTKAGAAVEDSTACVRLWLHELLRVFYDRLVDDTDRLWLGRTVERLTDLHFKERLARLLGINTAAAGTVPPSAMSDKDVLTGLCGLMYGDFVPRAASAEVQGRGAV